MHKVLRLHPGPPVELSAEDVYSELSFPGPGTTAREAPYVAINMVSTIDGKVTVGGKASPIGSGADREIMRNIRCAVDAVLVGAGTVRAEEMNLCVPRRLSEKRKARGLPDQPLGVVLAGAGELPLERKLFRPSDQRIVIIAGQSTPEKTLKGAWDRGIQVLHAGGPGPPSPDEVLRLLRKHFDLNTLLLEGGPSINGSFLSSGKADELFMTLSPKISHSNQDTLTISSGDLKQTTTNLKLSSVHASLQEDELYLRYLFQRPQATRVPGAGFR